MNYSHLLPDIYLCGYNIFRHLVHFVCEMFIVQRIKLQADVIDFQTERSLVTSTAGHRHTECGDFVQRNASLSILDATL